jgi:YD repeat-containing protein
MELADQTVSPGRTLIRGTAATLTCDDFGRSVSQTYIGVMTMQYAQS